MQEVISEPIRCEKVDIFLIKAQQVCYSFNFKGNRDHYFCSNSIVIFNSFAQSFRIFLQEVRLNFPQNEYHDYIINRYINFLEKLWKNGTNLQTFTLGKC